MAYAINDAMVCHITPKPGIFPFLALYPLPCDFPSTLWIFVVVVMHSKMRYLLLSYYTFKKLDPPIVVIMLPIHWCTITYLNELLEHPTLHMIRNVQSRTKWLNS